jgi:hypothetical protein
MKAKKTWQERAAEHRKAAVLEVVNRPKGEPIRRATKRISAKYNGRTLPGKKHLKLAESTLRRLFYKWKKDHAETVFAFHYVTPAVPSTVHPWIMRLFVDYAVHNGLLAFTAHKELQQTSAFPFSVKTVYRHLSTTDRQRISRATALHKKIRIATEELETITNKNRRES